MATRQWTAAVMTGTLIASLALAYALKVRPTHERWAGDQTTRHEGIGDLSVAIPESWPQDQDADERPWFTSQAFYQSPDTNMRLFVAQLPPSTVQTPVDMLTFALLRVVGEGQPQPFNLLPPPAHWRQGPLIVTTFSAVTTAGDGGKRGDAPIVRHTAALITSTGRQYWLIDLQQTHRSIGELVRNPLAAVIVSLRQRLCESVKIDSQRDATAEDFAAAQLVAPAAAPATPVTLTARVDTDHWPGNAIDLVPTDGPATLNVARVMGVIDSGTDDPNDSLHPSRLLTQQFIAATNRPPQPDELWSGQLTVPDSETTLQAWRLTYESQSLGGGDQSRAMLRRVYYVRYGRGRGLLIDLIGSLGDRAQLDQWAGPLAAWLMPSHEDASDMTAFDAAVQRGRQLAQSCADQTQRQQRSAMRYYLVIDRGDRVGFAIESVRRGEHAEMPWEGAALLVRVAPLAVQASYQWRSAAWGDPFAWRRAIQSADGTLLGGLQLQSDGTTLSRDNFSASGQLNRQWSVPKPDAYITPITESFWPTTTLEGGALVWIGDDAHPPQPHWVTHSQDAWLLRPLMAFDSERIEVDQTGQVRAWYDVSQSQPLTDDDVSQARRRMIIFGPPARGVLLKRVDRQMVLDTFAQMTAQIETWEQDHPIDDSTSDTLE
jgi:hypothetical protein